VGRYQKGKTNLDFIEARDSEWRWHQLGHMQVCTSLQTDNHTSTSPLSFLQAGCSSCHPTNSVKALKAEGSNGDCNSSILVVVVVVVVVNIVILISNLLTLFTPGLANLNRADLNHNQNQMICVKKSCDLITAAHLLRLSDRAEQKILNTCTSLFEVVPGMINFLYSLSMSLREHLSSALLKMLYKKCSVF